MKTALIANSGCMYGARGSRHSTRSVGALNSLATSCQWLRRSERGACITSPPVQSAVSCNSAGFNRSAAGEYVRAVFLFLSASLCVIS